MDPRPQRCIQELTWPGPGIGCSSAFLWTGPQVSSQQAEAGVCFLGDGAGVFRPGQILGELDSKVGGVSGTCFKIWFSREYRWDDLLRSFMHTCCQFVTGLPHPQSATCTPDVCNHEILIHISNDREKERKRFSGEKTSGHQRICLLYTIWRCRRRR